MTTSPLRLIGYWLGPNAPGWPNVLDFVDTRWDDDEKDLTIEYLRHGMLTRAYMGYSKCRFCGIENGNLELSDGIYAWPEGLVHYLVEHSVRLPVEFVSHVAEMIERLEESEIDYSWWRQISGEIEIN